MAESLSRYKYTERTVAEVFGPLHQVPAFVDLLREAPKQGELKAGLDQWAKEIWDSVETIADRCEIEPLVVELHLRTDKLRSDKPHTFACNIVCGLEAASEDTATPVLNAYFEAIKSINRLGTAVGANSFHRLHYVLIQYNGPRLSKKAKLKNTGSCFRQAFDLLQPDLSEALIRMSKDDVVDICLQFFSGLLRSIPHCASALFQNSCYLALPFDRPPIAEKAAIEPGGALFVIFKGVTRQRKTQVEEFALRLRHMISQACLKEAYKFGDIRAVEEKLRQEAEEARITEIHHRVKNNLLIIEAYANRGPSVMRSAVHGVLKLYEKMYSERSERLRLDEYLKELFIDLLRLNQVPLAARPTIRLDKVSDFPWQRAQAFGIMVVEILTNSIKHFGESRHLSSLRCKMVLKKVGNNSFELLLADNGPGFDQRSPMIERRGLTLIEDWVRFLHGDVICSSSKSGTVWKISFNHTPT
jgi:two-component sensor histidine kinase